MFDLLPEGMLLYKSYETLGLVVIQINCYLMTISSQQGKFRILSKKNVFIKIMMEFSETRWFCTWDLSDRVLCNAKPSLRLTWIQNYKTPEGQLLDYLECSTYYQLILCRTVCTDKTLPGWEWGREIQTQSRQEHGVGRPHVGASLIVTLFKTLKFWNKNMELSWCIYWHFPW